MTQEDKNLLLKDLCARLPYKVKVQIKNVCKICTLEEIDCSDDEMSVAVKHENGELCGYDFDIAKPYLFPLSSMTKEQREELYKIGWYLDEDKIYSCFRNYDDTNYKTHIDCFELVNWCYRNKFDINGLIPMGLANDATGLNIY